MPSNELLSALADGQLDGGELAQALQVCQGDDSALSRWNTYHLIGDVMRSGASAPPVRSHDSGLEFLERFNARLAQEPRLKAVPPVSVPVVSVAAIPLAVGSPSGQAANDATGFRWKMVAGFASLAAVSAIGWSMSGLLAPATTEQMAQVQVPSEQMVVASPQGPMVRDARLEELLAAHRQLGMATALQEPSGFLRNAAFELSQDERR